MVLLLTVKQSRPKNQFTFTWNFLKKKELIDIELGICWATCVRIQLKLKLPYKSLSLQEQNPNADLEQALFNVLYSQELKNGWIQKEKKIEYFQMCILSVLNCPLPNM